ncbi:MAG: PPC domain-containing protein [Anaerolineae bacterium]|nr:PPC domain-containing protein [Anaerolineae bacterium]
MRTLRLSGVIGTLLGLMAIWGWPAAAQQTLAPGQTVSGNTNVAVAYPMPMQIGDAFTIIARSEAFDTYLQIQDSAGNLLAEDDDGAGGLDSQITFVAPQSATYTVTLSAAFGDPSGPYSIEVESVNLRLLTYGDNFLIQPDGGQAYYLGFEASAGDVVNIFAASAQDTRLRVTTITGQEVAVDDDDGPGTDPYIRRLYLPEGGLYRLTVETLFDDPLLSQVELTLQKTEALYVGPEPTEIELGSAHDTEVLTLDAADGQRYRLDIRTHAPDAMLSIHVTQPGELLPLAYFNAQYMDEVSVVFSLDTGGLTHIIIDSPTEEANSQPNILSVSLQSAP